jgi:poly(hydroxyalkanoate) depolymerase family esterase
MQKDLGHLWWNGVRRIGRAQRNQGKKLVRKLLKASRTKPEAKPRAKPGTVLSRASGATARRVPAPTPIKSSGTWARFSHSSSFLDGIVPRRRMTYWLFVPAGLKQSPMPLVVMLHGCEQSATQFAQGTRMNLLAGKKGFAVLYPQQSVRANPQRCWNWYDKATQCGGGDVRMIAGVILKVLEKFPIDRSRVYIGGMSAGAAMANIVALHYPQLIAAVGLHSGAVFGAAHSPLGAIMVMQRGAGPADEFAMHDTIGDAENPTRMPAILIHGRRDYVVRSVNMTQVAQRFRVMNELSGKGSEPVIREHPRVVGKSRSRNAYTFHDYYDQRKLMLRVCEISELGHAWSGGDASLRFNDGDGPDASLLMWNFFAGHQRLTPIQAAEVLPGKARFPLLGGSPRSVID